MSEDADRLVSETNFVEKMQPNRGQTFDSDGTMRHLFAYGTLMCSEIMREVTGLSPSYLAGVVRDYSRRAVTGESYPGLLSEGGGHVEGIVYFGIGASAWNRLDRFEGSMYCRHLVAVELHDGSRTEALTYLVRPEFRWMLSGKDWDYANFLQHGVIRFERHYSGYGNL